MKESFVADLRPGSSVNTTFLVQNREQKTSRSGDAYLEVRLQDATGVILGRFWDSDGRDFDFEVNDRVRVEGDVEEYQGTCQLRLRAIVRETASVDLRDYLPCSPRDPEVLYAALLQRLRRMPDGPLRALLLAVMEDAGIARKYKLAPAAVYYHHAYLGGLLEHVSSLVELGDLVVDHYPSLNRELVIAGVVLHDLGKIDELEYDGAFRYSTRGRLVGHIVMGLEMVRAKIQTIPGFPEGLQNQIEHLILAHHGKPEFGSPREPMFPEAMVVHYLDDLDSKLEAMRAQYEADHDRPGEWTARNPALRRELFKVGAAGKKVGPSEPDERSP